MEYSLINFKSFQHLIELGYLKDNQSPKLINLNYYRFSSTCLNIIPYYRR